MLKPSLNLAAIAALIALTACGGSDKVTDDSSLLAAGTQGGSGNGNQMMAMCPLMSRDVTMTLSDVGTGVAVDFVTSKANKVDALRTCIGMMVEMHGGPDQGTGDPGTGEGGGHEGHHSAGRVQSNGMGGGMMGGGNHGGMMGGGDHGGMMGGGNHGDMMGGGMDCARMCQAMMGEMGDEMGEMHDHFSGAAIAFEEIEGGARLTFTAADPGNVETVRTTVREHFESMRQGECPMMH